MRGNVSDNMPYLDGANFEKGQRPEDLAEKGNKFWGELTSMGVDEAMLEVKEKQPYVYLTQGQKIKNALLEPYVGQMEIVWIWGETGIGKTRRAHFMTKEKTRQQVTFNKNSAFYDYKGGAEAVIMNEIDKDGAELPLGEFLTLTDRYEKYLNVKGAHIARDFSCIIFTTTVPPQAVYPAQAHAALDAPYTEQRLEPQVARRITQVIHQTEPWEED
jgi:hypothetical protein